jgi:hypothetical protein
MSENLINSTTPQEVAEMGKKLVVYVVDTFPDLERLYNRGVRMVMTDDVIMVTDAEDKLDLEDK